MDAQPIDDGDLTEEALGSRRPPPSAHRGCRYVHFLDTFLHFKMYYNADRFDKYKYIIFTTHLDKKTVEFLLHILIAETIYLILSK